MSVSCCVVLFCPKSSLLGFVFHFYSMLLFFYLGQFIYQFSPSLKIKTTIQRSSRSTRSSVNQIGITDFANCILTTSKQHISTSNNKNLSHYSLSESVFKLGEKCSFSEMTRSGDCFSCLVVMFEDVQTVAS